MNEQPRDNGIIENTRHRTKTTRPSQKTEKTCAGFVYCLCALAWHCKSSY